MNKQVKNLMSKSLSMLSDKNYSKLTFLLKQKRLPNLSTPIYINDKLLSMKLTIRNPKYKTLVDKYQVRVFIKDTIGEEYLIPLIGVYKDPSEVDLDSLPNKFALKLTNGSQNNLICTDKSKLNWQKAAKDIRNWMKLDPYIRTREWQYKDLPSRFVIEEYISDSNGEQNDYKFWCFNGEPQMLQIDTGRNIDHRRDLYNARDFKELPFTMGYLKADKPNLKPINYEKMYEIATILAKGLPFVRVDLYNLDGRIYFGELTFYPNNCNDKISPFKYEKILGDMLNYPITAP